MFVVQLFLLTARVIFLFSELRTKLRPVFGSDLILIVEVCEVTNSVFVTTMCIVRVFKTEVTLKKL